jgi:hypothetical protein
MLVVALLLGITLGAAACTEEATDPSLDPAPVQRDGRIGQDEDLFGVVVQVLRIVDFTQSPAGFPRLAVTFRSENTTLTAARNPEVQLHCDEARKGGDWFAGSTWEANGYLAPGAIDEGVIYIGFPAKPSNSRYAVATCTHARVVVTGTRSADRAQVIVSYPVSGATIAQAVDQPRGREMPLPPSVQ